MLKRALATLMPATFGWLLLAASPVAAQESGSAAGDWEGKISAQGMEYRIAYHIAEADDGTLSATLDSPDQGAFGLPFDSIETDGESVRLSYAAAGAVWEGTLTEDGRLDGVWRQGGSEIPLVLHRVKDETAEEGDEATEAGGETTEEKEEG